MIKRLYRKYLIWKARRLLDEAEWLINKILKESGR